jgi:hypothetical protein
MFIRMFTSILYAPKSLIRYNYKDCDVANIQHCGGRILIWSILSHIATIYLSRDMPPDSFKPVG